MSKYFDKSLLLGGNAVMLLMEDIVTSLGSPRSRSNHCDVW